MGSFSVARPTIQPIEQPDLLQNYGRLLQWKGLQQQQAQQAAMAPIQQQTAQIGLQQQQQALKDQQATTAAMREWDGKSLDELAPLMIKKGASAQAVMGLKQQALAQKEKYSQIAKDDAATGQSNIKTLSDKNGMIAGKLASLEQVPDEQLGQAITQGAQELVQQGLLDPQHAQTAQQLAQLPPAQARQALETMRKGLLSDSQLLEDAQKQAQTQALKAEAEKTQLENEQMKQYGGLTGPSADAKYRFLQQKMALGQQITPEDQAYIKGYEKQKLLVPVTSGNLRIEGYSQMREYPVYDKKQGATVMVTPSEINRAAKEEPGRYTSPGYTPESLGAKDATNYFTQGKGGQQLTAFNTALLHLNTLDRLAGDLNNTDIRIANKAKQAWAEQTGNPAPANFAAAVNAMSGEVASALKASGATDQEIDKASSTFDKAQSPAQLKGAINTYRELLNGKASQLRRQYNSAMQGKPAFDNQPQQPNGGGPVTVTLPSGKKISIE